MVKLQELLDSLKAKWIQYKESICESSKIVEDLRRDHAKLQVSDAEKQAENVSLIKANQSYLEEINGLKLRLQKSDPHSSIEAYGKWCEDNIIPTPQTYNFRSKGNENPHLILEDSLKDESVIRQFIELDLEFDGSRFKRSDDLVYRFEKIFSKKYPTKKYYSLDINLYGVYEKWAIAKQTIKLLRKGGKAYDCDDVMVLIYSCLYYLLLDNFPEDIWRLKCFIVDLWTGGGHALLGWVKEGPNDYIVLETTFFDTKQREIWNGDYAIHSQLLYQIRYSFDNLTEYMKI